VRSGVLSHLVCWQAVQERRQRCVLRRSSRDEACAHPPAALPAAAAAPAIDRLCSPPGTATPPAAVEGRMAPPSPEGRERQPLRVLCSVRLAAAVVP
jgi:hypothetical protein